MSAKSKSQEAINAEARSLNDEVAAAAISNISDHASPVHDAALFVLIGTGAAAGLLVGNLERLNSMIDGAIVAGLLLLLVLSAFAGIATISITTAQKSAALRTSTVATIVQEITEGPSIKKISDMAADHATKYGDVELPIPTAQSIMDAMSRARPWWVNVTLSAWERGILLDPHSATRRKARSIAFVRLYFGIQMTCFIFSLTLAFIGVYLGLHRIEL